MTELLYLPDSDDMTEFTAVVEDATDEYLVLDAAYFYPEGGGQPPDTGAVEWDGGGAGVADVQKESGEVRHYIDTADEPPAVGDEIGVASTPTADAV